ncbi:hypothetical protein WS73_23960 [Burkholderia savannae]|nr:hypothetical protein WS73_23960 [Burkholderia savannae]
MIGLDRISIRAGARIARRAFSHRCITSHNETIEDIDAAHESQRGEVLAVDTVTLPRCIDFL